MPPRAATLPLLIVQGEWTEARELAIVSRAQGSPLERQMGVTILGNLARYQGNTRLAWEMVREAVPRGPASEPEDGLFPYATEALRLAVKLALDASDLAAARGWLGTHDRWLAWSGAVRGRAESHLLWARLHQQERDIARSLHCAHEALRLATEPRQPLALLEAFLFLGRLCMDEQRYPDAERHLTDALALASTDDVPHSRACALVSLADLYLRIDREKDAPALLEQARDIATRLGAAPLLTAIDALETRLDTGLRDSGLTSRETDVLRLVAQGLTDAEVAERLYISPRTVGQHLRSIYNKLDVSSRTAATRFAVENRLL